MKKIKRNKSVPEIYRIKVGTYRRTLELRVGGGKEYFEKEFGDTGLKYELNNGLYKLDDINCCNIIWLQTYDLSVLVHELMHCTLGMLEQVGEYAEGETPAYIYEEMFTKIWIKCGHKFSITKDTKDFFKD